MGDVVEIEEVMINNGAAVFCLDLLYGRLHFFGRCVMNWDDVFFLEYATAHDVLNVD